jgi:hypothetical protein
MRQGIHEAEHYLRRLQKDIETQRAAGTLVPEDLTKVTITLIKQFGETLQAISQIDNAHARTIHDMTYKSHHVIEDRDVKLPIERLARTIHIPILPSAPAKPVETSDET